MQSYTINPEIFHKGYDLNRYDLAVSIADTKTAVCQIQGNQERVNTFVFQGRAGTLPKAASRMESVMQSTFRSFAQESKSFMQESASAILGAWDATTQTFHTAYVGDNSAFVVFYDEASSKALSIYRLNQLLHNSKEALEAARVFPRIQMAHDIPLYKSGDLATTRALGPPVIRI